MMPEIRGYSQPSVHKFNLVYHTCLFSEWGGGTKNVFDSLLHIIYTYISTITHTHTHLVSSIIIVSFSKLKYSELRKAN